MDIFVNNWSLPESEYAAPSIFYTGIITYTQGNNSKNVVFNKYKNTIRSGRGNDAYTKCSTAHSAFNNGSITAKAEFSIICSGSVFPCSFSPILNF